MCDQKSLKLRDKYTKIDFSGKVCVSFKLIPTKNKDAGFVHDVNQLHRYNDCLQLHKGKVNRNMHFLVLFL